jgi:hypothetical protein
VKCGERKITRKTLMGEFRLGWKTFSLQSKKKINKKKEYPHFPFTVI